MFGFLKNLFARNHDSAPPRRRKPSIPQQYIINQNDAFKRPATDRDARDSTAAAVIPHTMTSGSGEADSGGCDDPGSCHFRPRTRAPALPDALHRGPHPTF